MPTDVRLTVFGSFIVMNRGWIAVPLVITESDPHPVPCDMSIACAGPQPKLLLSSPLKSAIWAPPWDAAQSRRTVQLTMVGFLVTLTVLTCASYPAPAAATF